MHGYPKLSRIFNLRSNCFFSDVILKRRRIGKLNICRLSKGLRLSGIDAIYFEMLVNHDNAQGEMKEYYKEAMGELRKIK